jgi:hypothetical protein
MKRTLSALAVLASLMVGVMSQTGAAAAAGPAGMGMSQPAASTDVQKVDHRRDHDRWDRRWDRGRDRHWDRRWDRRGPPRHFGPSSGIYFEFGTAPRVYRAPPRRAYGFSQAHVNWCYNRYRSYDAGSNTFQPYNGPRRACYSPYS